MLNIWDNKVYRIITLLNAGYSAYKWQILLMLGGGFLGGLFEGIGISVVVPLFSYLVGGATDSSVTGTVNRMMQGFFNYLGINFDLKIMLIFIVVLFLFRAVVLFLVSFLKVKVAANYEEKTRNALFAHFLKSKWSYLIDQKLGHMETVLMTNVRQSSLLLEHFCMVIITLSSLVVYIFVAMKLSPIVTLYTIGIGVVVMLVFKPLFTNTKIFSRNIENYTKKIAHFINENLLGMKSVKVMAAEKEVARVGRKLFSEYAQETVKISTIRSITNVLMQPIGVIFVSFIFSISYKAPGFNLGVMAATIYLIQKIFLYFQQMQASLHLINETAPYLRSVIGVQKEMADNIEVDAGKNMFSLGRDIIFSNVSFAYAADKKILNKINFKIKKGEMIGLVGPSGAGKTTVVDLILRLYNPSEGTIMMDDIDIGSIPLGEWRRNIGYVSQDIFLMNDTIANNIKFYNNITDAEMKEAAEMANIYDFIMSCPNKFETLIGDRGMLLSAGQRQRLIIARVLAKKPELLILDEATSSLDNESEAQIQKVISGLKRKLTVLIIAHRLSTVENSDRLVVLQSGNIVEEGSPAELLMNKESYFYKVSNLSK